MDSVADITGVSVGHTSDYESATGCTVLIFDKAVRGAVDLRGGGTSTRQIDSVLGNNTYGKIHSILLTGGSGYGLNASEGVCRYLEERGIGMDVGYGFVVPSVPTAVIFDLGIGNGRVRPDAKMAYEACVNAGRDNLSQGSCGVGTGATIGKIFGVGNSTKGGIGSASFSFESGVSVGVLVVVNSYGDVLSLKDGSIIAGVRDNTGEKRFPGTVELMKRGYGKRTDRHTNTTIAVVVTNASLVKSELSRVAMIAQTGISRVVSPSHTAADGDMVFAVSTGDLQGDANLIGVVASELVAVSINRAVYAATGLCGIPSASDFI